MPKGQRRQGDYRYLWQRGHTWWCQIGIPKALQPTFGKKAIKQSLKTRDVNEARRLRWPVVSAWRNVFERALAGEDMTSEEIESLAQEEYAHLAALESFESNEGPDIGLANIIDELGSELQHGHVGGFGDQAVEKLLAETGLTVSQDKREEIRAALLRAQIEAYDGLLRQRKGQPVGPPPLFNRQYTGIKPPAIQTGNSLPISEAISSYLDARAGDWIHKTRGQNETTLRLFSEHVGHGKPIAEITRLDVAQFGERLRRLHPRWASSASSKGLSLSELLKTSGNGKHGLSDKTISRHFSALHSMFDWCIDTGHLERANPVKVMGSKSKPRYDRGSFTDQEVARIFEGLTFKTQPKRHTHANALPWLALLGAFSGARLEELCNLRREDVKEENGVHYLDIRDSKTAAGVRRIPIHSQVIAAGFLSYVKTCRGWLWPSLGKPNADGKRGVYLGKVFARLCRDLGIDKPLVGFHYWRTTVITKLENAKVPEIEAARLVGHKIKTMSYGVYSGGPDLTQLQATVERIAYKGLELH